MIRTTTKPKTQTSFYAKHKVAFFVLVSLHYIMVMEVDLKTMQGNNGWQDCDDTTETLSLCDLPLNGFASDTDDFSKEEQSSSFDQDFFEFISEDFTASSCNNSTDTIIFCGKLIPYRGAEVADKVHDREPRNIPGHTGKGKSNSLNKSRKSANKHDHLHSLKKISILTAPIKSRWYLFAFGVGRFPMEMELSDMRTRQSMRNPSKKFQHDNRPEVAKSNSSKRAKGLRGLLKIWVARVNKVVL